METGWIGINERLPDIGEDVLLSTEIGVVAAKRIKNKNGWKWSVDVIDSLIISWMPIPC